jgi:hypothetical protein
MAERLLCDGVLSMRIDGAGDRTLVVVKDGTVVRFWADTSELEGVLSHIPIQLSAHEGSCLLRLNGQDVEVTLAVTGAPPKSCSFPASDLREALAQVRRAGDASPLAI